MEYVDGPEASQVLEKQGALDEKTALRLLSDIARALVYASDLGLVHRDIKPDNIMITSQGVGKLCDLGLAKSADSTSNLTLAGTILGTPKYMSPEQAMGNPDVDIRSDLFSLGSTFYHLLVGNAPFEGKQPIQVMQKIVSGPPKPANEANPKVSAATAQVIAKLMRLKREDRYQSPAELLEALEGLGVAGSAEAPAIAIPTRDDIQRVAFQLSDDLLDIASESAESGKTPGTDLREGVVTLPVLYALADDAGDASAVRLRELIGAGAITNDSDLDEALDLLRNSPALKRARETVRGYAERARNCVVGLPDTPARAALESLADFIADRSA
jgi:serine/threonine protein kinase